MQICKIQNMKKTIILLLLILSVQTNGQCWLKIAGGAYHNIAIKSDGSLWAWGFNSNGELGNGTANNSSIPIQIGTATNWQNVACGFNQSFGIKTDGTLWAWGKNEFGNLGDGSMTNKYSPTQIGSATNWQSVSAYEAHTLATKTDGTLWSWGYNAYGQLGDGTIISKVIPTQIGTATNWQSVSAGGQHSIAIKTNGTLWSWGWNIPGQLGNGDNGISVYTPTQVGVATNWQSVSCGYDNAIAIKLNGTLWSWGSNQYGKLGDGTSNNRYVPTCKVSLHC